eukprot:jgi/Tetstr1/440416/TSEL_028750.t1
MDTISAAADATTKGFKRASSHQEYQNLLNEAYKVTTGNKLQNGVSYHTAGKSMRADLHEKSIPIGLLTCTGHIKRAIANYDGVPLTPQKPEGIFVPSSLKDRIATVVRWFRDRKHPVFPDDVKDWANREIAGTIYADNFLDGKVTEGWYRGFLRRQGMLTIHLRPLEMARHEWLTEHNLADYYEQGVVICDDGVGLHVGISVLEEAIKRGIEIMLRVPNLSFKLQGEDVISFLVLKLHANVKDVVEAAKTDIVPLSRALHADFDVGAEHALATSDHRKHQADERKRRDDSAFANKQAAASKRQDTTAESSANGVELLKQIWLSGHDFIVQLKAAGLRDLIEASNPQAPPPKGMKEGLLAKVFTLPKVKQALAGYTATQPVLSSAGGPSVAGPHPARSAPLAPTQAPPPHLAELELSFEYIGDSGDPMLEDT